MNINIYLFKETSSQCNKRLRYTPKNHHLLYVFNLPHTKGHQHATYYMLVVVVLSFLPNVVNKRSQFLCVAKLRCRQHEALACCFVSWRCSWFWFKCNCVVTTWRSKIVGSLSIFKCTKLRYIYFSFKWGNF